MSRALRGEVVGYVPEPLHAFAYVSEPLVPFGPRDVSDLLLACRRVNALHGVTGKLVVLEDGERAVRFAQWVEGPRAGLAVVVERIRADPRHVGLAVRFEGPVARRRFEGWEMAFAPVEAARFEPEAAALAVG